MLIIYLYEESPRRIEHEPPTVFIFFSIRLGTADLIFADRWIDGDRTPTALQVTSAPLHSKTLTAFCESKWWSHHGLPPEGGIYLYIYFFFFKWSRKDTVALLMILLHIHTFIFWGFFLFRFFLLFDRCLFGLDKFLESGTFSSLTYFSLFIYLPARWC